MMKRTFETVLAFALSLIMVLGLAACGTKTTISLNETALIMGIGDSKRLVATVSDGSMVEWSTSDEEVATVSGGVVRGVGAGEATITATANGVSAECDVTVENIYVELDKTELSLDYKDAENKTAQLTATVKKGGVVTDETVTWSSSDESVATVSNGLVTAVGEGTVSVTAKRSGGNATASCIVTVVWANKPEGYKVVSYYEQNKVPVNTWGYWYDPANYVAGILTADEAYSADSEASDEGVGMAYFAFTTTSRGEPEGSDLVASNYQIIFRAAGEGGLLETNYRYTLTFELTSNVAGEIAVNNERVDTSGKEGEVHKFDIIEGKNEISVDFNHYDDGKIYSDGIYTNVASAIFLLPGKLGELGQQVQLTLDNIHWVKGEAVDPLPEAEIPDVDLPDLSGTEAVKLGLAREDTSYAITTEDEGLSYNILYTDVPGGSYQTIEADITETDVLTGNTFSMKIKNNAETDMRIRIDIAGNAIQVGDNPSSRDCALSSVASIGSPYTDTTWDGTSITVSGGDETVVYITYESDGVHGEPTQLLIYLDTSTYGDSDSHSGNITLSEFKFAYVEGPSYEAPENSEYEKTFTVGLAKEDEKAVYTICGILTYKGYTEQEVLAHLIHRDDGEHTNGLLYGINLTELTEESLEKAIGELKINLQENPFAMSGSWEGNWLTPNFDLLGVDVTVTRDGDTITITYEAKYDVTELDVYKYTGHYGWGWKQDNGNWVEGILDFKPGKEYQSEVITIGNKTYQMVVVPSDTSGAEFWGCVGLIVENAD